MLLEYQSKPYSNASEDKKTNKKGDKKKPPLDKNQQQQNRSKHTQSSKRRQGLFDGVVTIVAESNVGPRGVGSREFIKNPPPSSRPRTAFDTHTSTTVSLEERRPDSVPLNEHERQEKRDQVHYYTPQHGLAGEVSKLMPSKGKLWQDLTIEAISTKSNEPIVLEDVNEKNEGENEENRLEESGDAPISETAKVEPHPKKSAIEFIQDFNTFVGDISIDKVMFKSWVSTMVPIPEIDLSSTKKAMEVSP